MATLIEVIDRARLLLNEPLDATRSFPDNTSTFYTDNALRNYVNLVQEECQQEMIQTFEDYFVTEAFLNISAGVAGYDLPSGLIKVRRVEDVGDNTSGHTTEVRPVSLNNKTPENFTYTSGTIRGGGYYIHGTRIVFTSTPTFTDSARLKIHYIKKIPDVTAASAISEIPLEHHGVLVWGTVKYALFQGQSDTARADEEYTKRMIKLKRDAETRQIQRPRKVKNTQGDADFTKGAF
jgi:hypothetical protein